MRGPTMRSRSAKKPTIPALALVTLRQTLAGEVGPDIAARALQAAGMAAGNLLYERLEEAEGGPESLRRLSYSAFVQKLSGLLQRQGWGSLAHERLHPGVGSLASPDWGEADPDGDEARPSCFFSTGLLANLLGNAAGEELAVLEVECRSQGDERCRFAFGSETALVSLYGSLAEGMDFESSVSRLA